MKTITRFLRTAAIASSVMVSMNAWSQSGQPHSVKASAIFDQVTVQWNAPASDIELKWHDDKSYNGMVRLLPVDNFYEPIELQVVEWKEDGVNIMYTGAGTHATTKIGTNTEGEVPLSEAKIDHAVYNLTTSHSLPTVTNQPLIITIKDGATTVGAIKLTIPAIVATTNATTKSLVTSLFILVVSWSLVKMVNWVCTRSPSVRVLLGGLRTTNTSIHSSCSTTKQQVLTAIVLGKSTSIM